MKAINQKQQKLQHLLQLAEERKLNKLRHNIFKKACFITCLFLCLAFYCKAQDWKFDARSQQAYDLILNLQIQEAQQLIPDPQTPQEQYVTSLGEVLELLITEDRQKFDAYEDRFEERAGRKVKANNPEDTFIHAE